MMQFGFGLLSSLTPGEAICIAMLGFVLWRQGRG